MDTEKCKMLLTTIEMGSLSAAAEKLSYTTSGISRMMAALEAETGFPLLTRSRNGVVPTQNCIKMLPIIRELARWGEQYHQLSAEICGLETGTVTIGSSYSVYYRWISKLIASFQEKHPHIEVKVMEGNSSSLSQMMDECKIDLCIISKRNGHFTWTPLREDPLVALVPNEHPLAKCDSFPINAYETEAFIATYVDQDTDNARFFAKNNIKPNTRFSTSDSFATYYMVEAGLGVSLNNTLNVKGLNGAVTLLLLEPPQKVEIGIAALASMSPAAKKFVELAKKQSPMWD